MMIHHDTVASSELSFSCTFYHSGLRLCTSVLFLKFLSLPLSTTLVLCRTVSAERIELFLSLSGSSRPWLGELSRSVLSASVGFLVVIGGFSGC